MQRKLLKDSPAWPLTVWPMSMEMLDHRGAGGLQRAQGKASSEAVVHLGGNAAGIDKGWSDLQSFFLKAAFAWEE